MPFVLSCGYSRDAMNQSKATKGGSGTPVTGPAQQSFAEPSAPRPAASEPQNTLPSVPDHELLFRIGGGSYGDVWLAKNAVEPFAPSKSIIPQASTATNISNASFADCKNSSRLPGRM